MCKETLTTAVMKEFFRRGTTPLRVTPEHIYFNDGSKVSFDAISDQCKRIELLIPRLEGTTHVCVTYNSDAYLIDIEGYVEDYLTINDNMLLGSKIGGP